MVWGKKAFGRCAIYGRLAVVRTLETEIPLVCLDIFKFGESPPLRLDTP